MNDCELIEKWLSVFGENVDRKIIENHVTAYRNFLWHLFTWGNVPCLEGDEARKAFDDLQYSEAIRFYDGYSNSITDVAVVGKFFAKELDEEQDVYIVAKDFSWTYVHTHESRCGPYLCIKKQPTPIFSRRKRKEKI